MLTYSALKHEKFDYWRLILDLYSVAVKVYVRLFGNVEEGG